MKDFKSTPKIDAHVHYNSDRPSLLKQAQEDNFSFITINTNVPGFPSIVDQQRIALGRSEEFPGVINHITTFPVDNWENDDWQEQTLKGLKQRLANGAVGVKIWKNIGMELQDQNGQMVMVDNEKFDPIFKYLEQHDIPVIGHLGEPRNCWLPIEQMTVESDKDYFTANPEYYMHLHPEYPSYEDQINARDGMLDKFPNLRFIGAHLASLEWSVDEVGNRFDKYPKLSVDLAERVCHLQHHAVTDPGKVIDFIKTYQDRIIYGTDVIDDGTMSDEELNAHIRKLWLAHWEFFTTDKELTAPEVSGTFRGLNLPDDIIDKIFYKNAVKWYRL